GTEVRRGRAGRLAIAARHDFEILHRASSLGECARHPHGGDRRRRAHAACGRAISQRGAPTISVTTRYPGAGARAVVCTVALPTEQQVNGVDGMIYMQSFSAADGSYTLIVTFKIGMDINFAQVLVQNRVSSALAQLPQAVQAQGVTVQQK